MPSRRLDLATREQWLSLGQVGAGELFLHGAVLGGSDGRMEVRIVQPSGFWPWAEMKRSEQSCEFAAFAWKPCRLPIARSGVDTVLAVRMQGQLDDALLSSPLVIPDKVEPGPPVFVILADTLRFDRLVTYVPTIPLGLNIDELARDGVVFERMRSSSSWTRTAVATLLTGLDPHSHGVLGRTDVLSANLAGLPQRLRRSGWRTTAWSTNANVLPVWGFDTGFDAFVDLGALDWVKNKTDAATVFAAVLSALDREGDTGAFHYIHLMDPHAPYLASAEDLEAVDADPRLATTFPGVTVTARTAEEYRRYLAEIRDLDRALGAFLDELRRRGLYERALILVISDHGEEFLDHGGVYHGKTLYEEVLRVPAILKLPGNSLAGTRLRGGAGLSDIAPTLLGILGVEALGETDGRSLWDSAERVLRDDAHAQTALLRLDTHHKAAVVDDHEKLIIDYVRGGAQVFDLRSDPHEQIDLVTAEQRDVGGLRAVLDSRMARGTSGWHLRACGGATEQALRLQIHAEGALSGLDLEEGDVLRRLEGSDDGYEWEAALQLTRVNLQREVFGRMLQEEGPDEDEVVMASSGESAISVRVLGSEPLRYAFGIESRRHSANEVRLRLEEATVVSPSTPVNCWEEKQVAYNRKSPPSAAERDAYVRIWFVPPVEKREEAEVDAGVRERLRALGYDW